MYFTDEVNLILCLTMVQFAIYLQSINLHKRLIHRISTKVNNAVKQCNKIEDKKENNCRSEINKPINKFPGYKVIYTFPHIKYINYINVLKRNQTILTGVLIPITMSLQMIDFISINSELSILLTSKFDALYLTLMCNCNFVIL